MVIKFSDRIGVTKANTFLQIKDISVPLRNSIWNYLYQKFLNDDYTVCWNFVSLLCVNVFKEPIDTLPSGYQNRLTTWIKKIYFDLKWFEVYNLIEFINTLIEEKYLINYSFVEDVNNILEIEMSGFRFISGVLSPITTPAEIESIENVIEKANEKELFGAAKHIKTAIEHLSNKINPDYRNSIKESISAVESVVKKITGEKGGGLENALKTFDNKVKFHGAFKSGLLSLYGYTSDENGIRHSILELTEIGFDEAKFMLVSCSSVVNYLIAKAEKAELL